MTRAPGPRGLALLRRFNLLRQDPLRLLAEDGARYGPVVRYRLGWHVLHVVRHPDHVKHVLQDNHRNYRRSAFYDRMKPMLGEGLLTSDGELWRGQRRSIQPAFHRERHAALARVTVEETEALLERWADRDEPFDVAREMMSLTLSIAGRTLFHAAVEEQTETVRRAMALGLPALDRRTNAVLPLPMWLPTPVNRRLRRAKRMLDGVVAGIIAVRRAGGERHDDVLDLLLDARDEQGRPMSDRQIADEVLTLLLAGHETTANLLAWTWHLLGRHPEIEQRLHEEIDRLPDPPGLAQMPYTRRVLEESLRLYPPAWAIDRQAVADDELGGHHVPAGSVVLVSAWLTQRDPAWWPEPERFDPERMTEEQKAGRPRYAYFPFGGGPRQCIGMEFALVEATLALALVARRFRLVPEPGHPVEPETSITLRPRHGLVMRRVRR